MAILLEGGCRVSALREGKAQERGTVRAWSHVGRATGASAISLRVLDFAPGRSPTLGNAACDEVLYVLEGAGTLFLDAQPFAIGPETGLYVRPGARFEVENLGSRPLTILSSRCPDPGTDLSFAPPAPSAPPPAGPSPLVRLFDRTAEVTGDRWYRVLVDEKVGSTQVTQFVGAIPPGRAPEHFHEYEEVLCILHGTGRMWAGRSHTSLEAGSCVFLPRRQVHCVENVGDGELRLLGVFYPAGSPAVRYAADET